MILTFPMYVIAFLLVGVGFTKARHIEVNASIGSACNLGSGLAALTVGAVITRPGIAPTLAIVAAMVAALGATALAGTANQTAPAKRSDQETIEAWLEFDVRRCLTSG